MSTAGSEAVAAATVLLLRDGEPGLEVLMLHRTSKVAFGGMWVFPGGRVDPADFDEADEASDADAVELAAARRAAVREAAEETGLIVSREDLVVHSHWMPPAHVGRRFSTWFFLAPAPAGVVVVDGGEIRDHRWLPPADAIVRRDAAEIELAPPTWVTLHNLAQHPDVASALAAARDAAPVRFATRMVPTDDGMVGLWHGDAGYEDGDVDRPGARHRLTMLSTGWRYES
jgi:8-oxo-dGTP pyrophosphatase MutT (NUDIX family)